MYMHICFLLIRIAIVDEQSNDQTDGKTYIMNSVFESVGLPCITVHIPMLSYLSPTTITGQFHDNTLLHGRCVLVREF